MFDDFIGDEKQSSSEEKFDKDNELFQNGLEMSNISAQPDLSPAENTAMPLKQPIPPADDDFFLPDFGGDSDENEPYHTNSDLKP